MTPGSQRTAERGGWRGLVDRYRWRAAAVSGGAVVVLGSLYEKTEGGPARTTLLGLIFVLGGAAVLLTFSVLHPERDFRAYQPWAASAAGGAAGALAAIANGLPSWRLWTVLAVAFVLGGVAVLFTQPRPIRPAAGEPAPPAGAQLPGGPAAGAQPAGRRAAPPSGLPRRQQTFRARAAELQLLFERDGDRQPAATVGSTAGPNVLLIHGMPGVGKSALALEFAHRAADRYPDGQLHANLGLAGSARPEGDVLKDLLEELGRVDIPETTSARSQLFRSLTAGKAMLVVLDAARTAQQVQQILPNSERCTVVVTSRRDLGPALGRESLRLALPDAGEAGQILRTYARVGPAAAPVCTAQILAECGRLPRALRAAGELATRANTDLCRVAADLRERTTRLAVLARGGRNVAGGFAAEFDRLLPQEREAFRLLALVPSETFVAWVLSPLLDVDVTEAENLMTQLSVAQLLEAVPRPEPSGLVRYQFHPLVREYARGLGAADDPAAAAARTRLDEAGFAMAARVLAEADPTAARVLATPGHHPWLPADSPWPARIAGTTGSWVRAEHANLVRVVRTAADLQGWEVCWRVAARLGDCLPDDADTSDTETALDIGLEAAAAAGSPVGRAEVGIAKAAFLVAVERYEEADAVLDKTEAGIGALGAGGDPHAAGLARRVLQLRVEAALQMAAYREAKRAMTEADQRQTEIDDPAESDYLAVLRAEVNGATDAEHWRVYQPFQDALARSEDDGCTLRAYLGGAEAARRHGNHSGAEDRLQAAEQRFDGDARRTAAVQFRRGRHALHRSLAPEQAQPHVPATEAIDWLANALVTFDRMGNAIGGLRTRCLLVRAFVAAGRVAEASEQVAAIRGQLARLGPGYGAAQDTVRARLARAEGEVLLETGHVADALRALQEAKQAFAAHDDWWSAAEASILLGRANRQDRRLPEAMATLWDAVATFNRCGDQDSLSRANAEIGRVVRDMGGYPG